ncbi:hypothetical protein CYMTET_15860 [Cymbomonas tetramitiformis]|uniref:Reverse transcriptase Ty1/copia-type domain-containing protein n=1 Tax=Cymbomonas tetramitiformis TaxID=36881 RepID=A0AAE0GDP8_9CHLO|nr:hypothetical protein CYMTET_15860 [Cymbomonas tetramitiformis]
MATKSIFNDLSMFEGAQQADVLKVEAQYAPQSPFNLVSAVSLEDKFGLYAQFGDRVLKDKENLREYDGYRKGNVYVLPEVFVETALPGVECDKKENCPVRDKCNWKFTEFQKWNEEKGPFHLDMCADKHNRQVSEFYSMVNSVFLHCLTGRSFWGNPPYDDIFIEKLLTKILMHFPKDPVNTKFMLVVPYKPNAMWWRLNTKIEELQMLVILERHAGVSGSAIDVGEARVRFETRHVALAAKEEKLTGLPVGVTEPKGWVQLVNGPDSVQWQESDHREECVLIDVKQAILPVETVPAGEKVMRMVAVYKAKLDSAGALTERKTRWAVCGNGQQHGVHYEDVYAPCTQLSTLRILIQLSLVLGLVAFSLDVITCFLNGELDVDTPMYVSWPNAWTIQGVLYGILQKSVYGLKQAPRIWYKTSKEFLLAYDHRLRMSNIDPCLFYIWQPGTLVVFVYVHVDDYTVFTSSVEWKVEFFRAFSEKWPSKDKGPLVELLGMIMTISDYGLVRECVSSQVGLIQRMLERYAMQECNPCMTPMEPRLSLMPVDSEEKLEKLPYVNLVMELMWLARCSRPDILTTVCYLAKFSHCYGQEHWQHLKRVLRYLKGTLHACLTMQCS